MAQTHDHEMVSIYPFTDEEIDLLMNNSMECVLMWATKDGWPVGVTHAFVWHDGKIWITFAEHRHRTKAIKRDNRVSVNVSACGYRPDASPETAPMLDKLAGYAINYYRDFVKPAKQYRAPDDRERAAMEDLKAALEAMPADADAETIQTEVYEVGKRHEFENLKDWFKCLYEVLLGQSQGPRMGSFIALYGLSETVELIGRALAGEDLSA